MRRVLAAFLCGFLSAIALALHAGPEAIVIAGLKYAAASSDYDWTAVPRERQAVSYDTRNLILEEDLPTPKPSKKGRR